MIVITTTLGEFGWILMEILFKLMEGAFYMMKDKEHTIGMVKMGSECGKEVFDKLMHGKINVTKHCCEKLVKMGESCHINMAKALIRTGIPR